MEDGSVLISSRDFHCPEPGPDSVARRLRGGRETVWRSQRGRRIRQHLAWRKPDEHLHCKNTLCYQINALDKWIKMFHFQTRDTSARSYSNRVRSLHPDGFQRTRVWRCWRQESYSRWKRKHAKISSLSIESLISRKWTIRESTKEGKSTHNEPPAAGPIALQRDIAVMDTPFAAPLCSFDWKKVREVRVHRFGLWAWLKLKFE